MSTRVEERDEMVRADLAKNVVEIERVAINREVDAAPGSSVSVVARRHDINANLLFKWKTQPAAEPTGGG